MKLAIVEDDPGIRGELTKFFQKYQYEVYAPDQFEEIVPGILEQQVHLVLLDINLPVYDGYYICRELRKVSDVPVIMVTSRDSDLDELMSMNLGADDFITKPYNTQILLARVSNLLRRTYQNQEPDRIQYGEVTLSLSRGVVQCQGKEAELSKNELHILALLIRNGERITSRTDLMNELWQSDEFVDENTLTVNINRLRRKLEQIGVRDWIKTKRGLGYSL